MFLGLQLPPEKVVGVGARGVDMVGVLGCDHILSVSWTERISHHRGIGCAGLQSCLRNEGMNPPGPHPVIPSPSLETKVRLEPLAGVKM